MVGVAVGTVAHHLSVDVCAAGLGVLQLLEDQHTAALAHDEAAAPCVEGQAGRVGVGGGGKGLHAGKAADAQRADAALCAAADHDRLIAIPDAVEGVAHGVGAAGAGRHRAGADALEAEADGDLGRCHVGDGHGDEVGADLFHPLLLAPGVLLLNGGQTADAAGHDDADVLGLRLAVDAAVLNGLGGSAQCQQGEAGHLAGLFFVHDGLGVEVLDLARQLALELAGVELGDGADAALACAGGGPAVGGVITKRVHGSQTGDDDSAFFHRKSSFYIAMPPSTQSTCPVR